MRKYHPLPSSLATILGALRAQGKTIVLANGCFDLLHVGHVRFLTDAKSRGDFLVVALNSDDSVRAIKGDDRPVMPAAERAEVLAALECVDYVTVFAEPTADEILRSLRPTIHAKGTDYEPASVPEAATLQALGVSTVICGDPKEHSTRDLLARLRGSAAKTEKAEKPEKASAEPAVAKAVAKASKRAAPAKSLPAKSMKPQPKRAAKAAAKPAPKLAPKPAPKAAAKPAPKKKAAGSSRRSSAKA